jgi:glycosyltransferase involved in cell wall biosynthesis
MSKDIWIVIPAYEEEMTIGSVLEGLKSEGYERIIVVDDGSSDRTAEISREKGAEVVSHEENRGLGAAISTGLKKARDKGADIVVTFDADGQHDTKDIERLVEALEDADFAVGERERDQMPLNKRVGNYGLDVITRMMGGVLTDSQSGLRAFGPKALDEIEIRSDKYSVSSEIIIQVGVKDLSFQAVPIKGIFTEYSKSSGTTIASGLKIFLDLLKLKVL